MTVNGTYDQQERNIRLGVYGGLGLLQCELQLAMKIEVPFLAAYGNQTSDICVMIQGRVKNNSIHMYTYSYIYI